MILYLYIIPLDVASYHGVVVGCCFLRCTGTLVLVCKINKKMGARFVMDEVDEPTDVDLA
jgi:hypothetical protein